MHQLIELDDLVVLQMNDRAWDGPTTTQLTHDLLDALRKGRRKVLLDMQQVQFMNSIAIRFLIRANQLVEAELGLFALVNVGAEVRQQIEVLQLNGFFTIYPSVADARKHFS